MALVKLRIKAGEGRNIWGHGAKERGEVIHVEEELARSLIESDPHAYELVVDTVALPPSRIKSGLSDMTRFELSSELTSLVEPKEEDKG